MTEGTVKDPSFLLGEKKQIISRRSFLKLAGVVAASAVTLKLLGLAADQLVSGEEHAAELALLSQTRMGLFQRDKLKSVENIDTLLEAIRTETEKLTGVSGARIKLIEGDFVSGIEVKTAPDIFAPGSLVKIPVAYYAWKLGENDDKEYLTKDAAWRILHVSESSANLIMKLPIARGKSSNDVESLLYRVLNESNIPPKSQSGEVLRISLNDMIDFLRRIKLPQIMEEAMLLSSGDDLRNYGVSKVLRDATDSKLPIYFKIGLATDGGQKVNSYYMQVGDRATIVGYAKGHDLENVSKQMLITGKLLGEYLVS